MSAPDKVKRKVCWKARDEYWECLNRYAPEYNTTSGDKQPAECLELRKKLESECPPKWVHHFDQKRNYEKYKQKMGLIPPDEQK